jgi:hypothetical protein
MYSKNFVVAILHNGKFCEESKDGIVALPFGSEYTIRLRNKNSRRAVAFVYIDEENVTGGGIVVDANNYIDLERSTTKAVKFKFVSAKSGEAIDAGKNNRTDGSNGVIRVEWKLEKEKPAIPTYIPVPYPYPVPYPRPKFRPYYGTPRSTYVKGGPCGQSMSGSPDALLSFDASASAPSMPTNYSECNTSAAQRENLKEGCTVEGSYSHQTFYKVNIDLEDGPGVVIRIVLRGYTEDKAPAVLHEAGPFCVNCGSRTGKRAKFCSKCGTKIQREKVNV